MKESNAMEPQWVLGVDLGDRKSAYLVIDRQGVIREESEVATRPKEFETLFQRWPGARVVIETGTHSPWVSRLAQAAGLEVVVANSRQLELISKNRRKGDRVDAALLARLGRADVSLLAPVRHRSREAQAKLALVRTRDAVVGARTKLINCVRGQVKAFGGRLPKCSAPAFSRRVREAIPQELQGALLPMLALVEDMSRQIRNYEREIAKLAAADPVIARLRQVHGVGLLVASTFVWTIEDPHRFRDSRQVAAYLGLVPRRDQSGQRERQLGISKAGDPRLRRLLLQAAQYLLGPLGPECDLRRDGIRVAGGPEARGNRKKSAVTAVARRIAVLLHHLWVTEAVYDPDYKKKKKEGEQAA